MQVNMPDPKDLKPIDWTKVLKILLCILLVTIIFLLWQQFFLRAAAWEYYKQYTDYLEQILFSKSALEPNFYFV